MEHGDGLILNWEASSEMLLFYVPMWITTVEVSLELDRSSSV